MVIETQRLILRELTQDDFDDLCSLISNPITYTDTSEDDMISLDDSTMKDSNGLFLNYKESE